MNQPLVLHLDEPTLGLNLDEPTLGFKPGRINPG